MAEILIILITLLLYIILLFEHSHQLQVREMKEQVCYVAFNPAKEETSQETNDPHQHFKSSLELRLILLESTSKCGSK